MTEQLTTPPPEENSKPWEDVDMMAPEELSEKQKVAADIIEFANEILGHGIIDDIAKVRSWKNRYNSNDGWQVVHLIETSHFMIQSHDQRLYCLNEYQLSAWEVMVNEDYEQEPRFLDKDELELISKKLSKIHQKLEE